MMDLDEIIRRVPHEPVGTHLLANRGAFWQKYKPGWWKISEAGLEGHELVCSDEEMMARLDSCRSPIMGVVVIWTLY